MAKPRLYRTEAIILREIDYGEADRILTLLTPGGQVSAIAKGVRRSTSHKVGHVDLFYRVEFMLARGRNLEVVTHAECLESYEGLRGDLLRFSYACYAGELVWRFAQEGEENEALYDLTTQGLRWLAVGHDPHLWMRYFQLRLLACSGYQPELFHCVGCGGEIRPQRNYFSFAQGGLLCPECQPHYGDAEAVSINAQKVMRYLQTHGPSDVENLRLKMSTLDEIEALLHGYLQYTLEREIRSVAFLRRLHGGSEAAKKGGQRR